jgi:hypothetical protein
MSSQPSLRHGEFFAVPCVVNHSCVAALCVDTLNRQHVYNKLTQSQLALVRETLAAMEQLLRTAAQHGAVLEYQVKPPRPSPNMHPARPLCESL